MDISIMVEGQMGLTWPRWQRIVRAADDLGYYGVFRSDHFANPDGPFDDALETWVSLAWAAGNSQRIALGTLVSPLSFRDPRILAWQASAVDSLAGGRLRLGLGAGWQEREHATFGFDLLDTDARFERFEEGIQVIRQLTRSSEPTSFAGDSFTLKDAMLKPRSPRGDGPPIVIGGNGPKRTLPLVAKYGDEWNAISMPADEFHQKSVLLDSLLHDADRSPSDVRRTLMTRGVIAADQGSLDRKVDAETRERQLARGAVIGTPGEIVEIIGRHKDAGVQGIALQWLDLDDISGLELFAADVFPQLT